VPKLDLVHYLPDGRRLAYCDYGDPDGIAVVALHGTPGSRYKFGIADTEARRLGLRLISPDRWGYGLSDAPKGTLRMGDYAADIECLLAKIGVDRFGVVGISGGGPFAAALACGLSKRVDALALVAPVAPLDRPEYRRGINLFHRFSFLTLPRVPGAVSLTFNFFRGALAVRPSLARRAMASRAGRPDQGLLGDPEIVSDLFKAFRAGLARGVNGASIDMRLFSRDWQFDLGLLQMPARMWLGTMDRNVPLGAARNLARRLTSLQVVEIEGAGHFWIARHYPEVLDWLAQTLEGGADAGGMRKCKATAEGESLTAVAQI
jgi:pimeloyl-ACP methyl ester carboxylesterase